MTQRQAQQDSEPVVQAIPGSQPCETQQVGVIIPCYNHAHFLPEAIESVLAQTHPHVEIVVVDDGSGDHTPEVAARYPQVRYVRQENQGLAAARNTGIRESTADYLVFLDADDRLLPGALETGLHYLCARPECAFVSGQHLMIAGDGSRLAPVQPRIVERAHYRAFLEGNYIAMIATVLFRRSALLAAGGFNPSLPVCEDYDLFLRIARAFPVYCHHEVIAEYRWHESNMSHNSGLMLSTSLAILRTQTEHLTAKHDIEAYRRGMAEWRRYYGALLYHQAMQDIKGARPFAALFSLLPLARLAPRTLLEQTGKTLKWVISTKLPSFLPLALFRPLLQWRKGGYTPAVGQVHFGDLRRSKPISGAFGFDRGQPIDRYYIENFLARHSAAIRGRVLEVGDRTYTAQYGGSAVDISDVLHVNEENPLATVVADLSSNAEQIPDNHYDCIILTQTLHLIYDVKAALSTVYRILKPGGVLLATVPGITQISDDEWAETWYWAFTTLSMRRILSELFPAANVEIEAHGSVLAATAFLQGIASEELRREELDYSDSRYQQLITVCAEKEACEDRLRSHS